MNIKVILYFTFVNNINNFLTKLNYIYISYNNNNNIHL